MSNIYIPLVAVFLSVTIFIMFNIKNKVKNTDTTIFFYIILISIIQCVSEVFVIYSAYKDGTTPLLYILNKIDLIALLLWIWILYIYIININKKITHNLIRSKEFIITLILNIILVFIIMLAPLTIINNEHVMGLEGSAVNILYASVAIYIIIIIITLLSRRELKNKKYIPIYVFIGLVIGIMIFRLIDPSLILVSFAVSYTTFIMYNTIENPDIKLVNELNLAVDSANKANMAKSDFLSSMSHEIRTPLNAIVGLSQDMLDNDKLPKELQEDASDVVNASNTLLEIVGNIIDISKIESNKIESIEMNYSIHEIVDSVIKLNQARIGEKDLKLSVTYAKDLPFELFGDKYHFKQVINNLISNAIKYTNEGHVKVNVKCINKEKTSLLIISVEDTGRGIKKENITRLFDKFDRLDVERNTTVEGVGLGLAITKRLVDLLGGKINVQSSFGYGSLFIVSVEQKINLLNKPLQDEIEHLPENQIILKNKKILIVDDNLLNIKVAKRAIMPLEMEVDETLSGKECIKKVKENKYDIILMDIMMPEMSGEETLKELKKDNNFNTPVIALTADAIQGAKEKYIESGFNDYLSKPFSKEQIEKAIVKLLK